MFEAEPRVIPHCLEFPIIEFDAYFAKNSGLTVFRDDCLKPRDQDVSVSACFSFPVVRKASRSSSLSGRMVIISISLPVQSTGREVAFIDGDQLRGDLTDIVTNM